MQLYRSRIFAILCLISVGIISRLIPHPPNFTALNSIALLSAIYFGSPWLAMACVGGALFFSDFIFGLHSTLPYVYLSFAATILLGQVGKKHFSLKTLPLFSVAASTLFFVVTNFGEWISGSLYPQTIEGLATCYIAAIPFFANQIIGDLTYGILLYYGFQYTTAINSGEFMKKNFYPLILSVSLFSAAQMQAHSHTTLIVEAPVPVVAPTVVVQPVVPVPAVEVMVDTAPPAEVEEVMTASPGANYVWVKGHWQWDGHRYIRVHGQWIARPRASAVWVGGCWVEHHGRWKWTEGYWQ